MLGVDDIMDLDERAVLHGAVVDFEDLVADVEDTRQEFLGALVHEARHELPWKRHTIQKTLILQFTSAKCSYLLHCKDLLSG